MLYKKMELKEAAAMAVLIYADIIAPALDEMNRQWEEMNRAKDNDGLN